MLSLLYFLAALVALNSVSAQYPIPDNKSCDQLCNSTKNFDPHYITGIHFITYEIPNEFMNTSKCIYVNYTRFNETHSYFTIYERRRFDNSDKITDGYLTYTDNGDMVISYTDLQLPMRFKLIAFDKDTYALIQCTECGLFSSEESGLYVHIHTKTPYPSCESLDRLMDAVADCGIPRSAIPQVDHSSCQRTCS